MTLDIKKRLIPLNNLQDERLRPYCNLRERTLRGESIFVAEGALVVERLLHSPYHIESILTIPKETNFDSILDQVPAGIPIYTIENRAAAEELLGFEFHQGILALGQRAPLPTLVEGMNNFFCSSENYINHTVPPLGTSSPARFLKKKRAWVVLPDATKPDNLGLAFRCAAALGAEAVVLGEECCDPFSRRALRVSMGGVLQTHIYRAQRLTEEIREVQKRWSIPFYATILDPSAHSLYSWNSNNFISQNAVAFMFGNEYSGLSKTHCELCNEKFIIPIDPNVDSLNLGVSVGVFLYEFNRPFSLAKGQRDV